jgi:peptidoglycan/LPS O-acetylase OafA/YrhL
LIGIVLPLGLMCAAVAIGRRERNEFREATQYGTDLFVYSRRRYRRRLFGVALLVATGATLAAIEWIPPTGPGMLTGYLAALVTEVVVLLLLPLVDLWETARTARPEDLTRQGDPERRIRSRPDRRP